MKFEFKNELKKQFPQAQLGENADTHTLCLGELSPTEEQKTGYFNSPRLSEAYMGK